MKKSSLILLVFISWLHGAYAQTEIAKHRIAVFTPLFLDSAFDAANEYRYKKNEFPKFISPGLEFYEGVQLALDSLHKENAPLEVFIYDSKSTKEKLAQQLKKAEMDSVDLIITHCNSSEIKIFAEAGLRTNTPVINVNLPNDGGVTTNPFFVVLNPTLRTQCEGLYRHMQKYYALNPIVVFRKKGQMEDRIKSYFIDFAKNTKGAKLDLRFVELTDSFDVDDLKFYLDTANQTLCMVGTLDEHFGKRLVQHLAQLNKEDYPSSVMGMPTWDAIGFNRPEYKGIEIVYSTPFYNAKTDRVSQGISNYFNKVIYARPSDLVFRGYEVTWNFAKLLMKYGKNISSNLTSKQIKVFTDYDIQPVLNKQNLALDYYENKKLYFLKWQDGVIKGIY